MLHLLKRKNTDLKKRIEDVTKFYEKERRQAVIAEKGIQEEIDVIDPQHQERNICSLQTVFDLIVSIPRNIFMRVIPANVLT